MRVSHLMLCDFAIPAAGNQKASIIGIFQVFNLPTLPFSVPRFYLVFEIKGESVERNRFEVQVSFRDGDGTELFALKGPVDPPQPSSPGTSWRANHVLDINGLTFERPGTYQILVLINGDLKAETELQVLLAPQN